MTDAKATGKSGDKRLLFGERVFSRLDFEKKRWNRRREYEDHECECAKRKCSRERLRMARGVKRMHWMRLNDDGTERSGTERDGTERNGNVLQPTLFDHLGPRGAAVCFPAHIKMAMTCPDQGLGPRESNQNYHIRRV